MPKDLSGSQVGMTPANAINSPRPNNMRGRNEFPQTHMHLTTDRYGEYCPFFWCKCERGDIQNLHTKHDLHTFTLKSPMVSHVQMTKSFIKVPMQAIYPRNWEKMFTIPTQGDDVPADTRALFDVRQLVNSLMAIVNRQSPFDSGFEQGHLETWFKAFFLLEAIVSHGSLFERFNMHLNYSFTYGDLSAGEVSFDKYFDNAVAPLILDFFRENAFSISGITGSFKISPDDGIYQVTGNYISPRRFFELLRKGNLSFETVSDGDAQNFVDSIPNLFLQDGYSSEGTVDDPYKNFLNIEPIIAYQLACAQFGSNDFVDFIYSAQLYRDNMQSLLVSGINRGISSSLSLWPTFSYNGTDYQYDVFSSSILSLGIGLINSFDDSLEFPQLNPVLEFFTNLFEFVPSLRFGDYFTGAKPRPLAVGEYSAQVNNNEVSAIDITRSIQMQRLLNRVNMVGRKLGDYLTGIFGGRLPEAPKDVPIFLAHQRFNIDGFEVNNTGSAQLDESVENTITSHLRTTQDKYSYEIEIDEPCYIIGMNSYETMRVYSRTLDRFAFHHDRYDDFIPEMQYIGDQDIMSKELDSLASDVPFGYALRYMEYKQRYSYASGGFIEYLPSWSFITDNKDGNPPANNIDPDYIRSSPSEFDRFYKSLTGYSLASYFHFIVAHTNMTSPYRMMEYTPEILK